MLMLKDRLTGLLPAKMREKIDPYMEALSIFTEVRDPRVLSALGPAGVRGLLLQRGKQGVPTKMPAHHSAHFDWTYPSDHPEMADLYRRAEDLGLGVAVVWTGFLDRTAKAAALADADVFVVPSQSESFGLSAVEALAAGIPTVISEGGAIADEVAANGAGIVVPLDAASMGDAIDRLLNDAGLASALSFRAAALVRSRYRPEAVTAELMKLYAEIGGRS